VLPRQHSKTAKTFSPSGAPEAGLYRFSYKYSEKADGISAVTKKRSAIGTFF
jgi:hypothetical protein